MRPLVAHYHFGLDNHHRRSGDRHDVEVHLTTSAAMYREMGMTYWLEQVEFEMAAFR